MKKYLLLFVMLLSVKVSGQENLIMSEEFNDLICTGISNLKIKGYDCFDISAFEEEMLRIEGLDCKDYLEDAQKRRDAVVRIWNKYYPQFKCVQSDFDAFKSIVDETGTFIEGGLLGYAVFGELDLFLALYNQGYKFNLNIPDYDGDTIIDWLDKQILRTDLSDTFKEYLIKTRADFEKLGAIRSR
jgi:hypothetical protein